MYTVYLADDEQLIREGLAETIPWTSLGLCLVGTAEDGKQALCDIAELKPDIVLTDIRMSHMNGLELIENIRKIHSCCRVIIITGHGEFKYAQAAIQLGVSDFILKPIDVADLCRVLRRLTQTLDGERNKQFEVEAMKEQLQQADSFQLRRNLRRYMIGQMPRRQFLESAPEKLRCVHVIMLVLLQIENFDSLTAAMNEEDIFSMTQTFEQSMVRAGENTQMIPVEETSGRYLLLFTGHWSDELNYEVRAYIRRLRLVEPELKFTTATSPVYNQIGDCQEAYEFVNRSMKYAFQLGSGRDIQPGDVKPGENNPATDIPDVSRVLRSISTFDKKRIRTDFDALAKDIKQTGHNSYLYTHMMVSVVYGELAKLLVEINCPIETILKDPLDEYRKILRQTNLDDMLSELYCFVAGICDFLDRNTTANCGLAEKARLYIMANYADSGMTLEQVADEMGITPSYFSALFKQNTGKSFINFLTDIRISHAKELLKIGSFKTYEVAARCGYDNPTYFSTIFKRCTGISPSEYRHEHLRLDERR